MDEAQFLSLFKQNPLFAHYSAAQLRSIMDSAKRRDYPADAPILSEGDESNVGFYLIAQGKVEVRKGGQPIAQLGPGAHFGEGAVLQDTSRGADVVATEPTTCLVLTRWALRGLLQDDPDLAINMFMELARRLQQTGAAVEGQRSKR